MYSKSKIHENSFSIAGFINLGSVIISALISMIFLYLLFYGEFTLDSIYQQIQTILVIGAILNITFLVFYMLGMKNIKSRSDSNNTSEISFISITASILMFFIFLSTIASSLLIHLIGINWIPIVVGVLSILYGLTAFFLYYISWRLFRRIINHVYIKKFNISFLFLGIFLLISNVLMSVGTFNVLAFVSISPLSIFLASVGGLFNIIISVVLIMNNGELKQEISRIKAV